MVPGANEARGQLRGRQIKALPQASLRCSDTCERSPVDLAIRPTQAETNGLAPERMVRQEQHYPSQVIERVGSEHGTLYLHVNREKADAIRFYERNGFRRVAEGSMVHKGQELSQVLMRRG